MLKERAMCRPVMGPMDPEAPFRRYVATNLFELFDVLRTKVAGGPSLFEGISDFWCCFFIYFLFRVSDDEWLSHWFDRLVCFNLFVFLISQRLCLCDACFYDESTLGWVRTCDFRMRKWNALF